MSCAVVRDRLSALRDGALPAAEQRAVSRHLAACPACAERWRGMTDALDALAEVPRLSCAGEVAAGVFDRLDMENRNPGLAALFRPVWAARPLIVPSLVSAVMVLAVAVTGTLMLEGRPEPLPRVAQERQLEAWTNLPSPVPDWGTEENPLFAFGDVSTPRVRGASQVPRSLLEQPGEGTLFLETVVARDGTVSAVNLIGADSGGAAPIIEAMRRERFEPGRFRGKPVAVSIYRLISRMEVRAPLT